MNITVNPGPLQGKLQAIPSKSQVHRMLICAAFADAPTELICSQVNQDMEATAQCLRALGAEISHSPKGYTVIPAKNIPRNATLDCGESGSTLRFLLPIAGALGVNATFRMCGRLPQRPLSPLWEEMERMGCSLSRPDSSSILCTGKLQAGCYTVPGNISSQFITGLMLALPIISGKSQLIVTGKIESEPYIQMTEQALKAFGVHFQNSSITGPSRFASPGSFCIEGDWSNSAFFLAANALGSRVSVSGLKEDSCQGDAACKMLLQKLQAGWQKIDGSQIPDLIPILAVTAGCLHGAEFIKVGRLRLKESDRIESTKAMLEAFGAQVTATEDTLCVKPCQYQAASVDACNDHRIAMAAAIGATVAQGPVTVNGAQCVSKSYPDFWEEFKRLGGAI